MKNTITKEDFISYFDKGWKVIPVGEDDKGKGKKPLILGWQNIPWQDHGDCYELVDFWFEKLGDKITGLGILMGAVNHNICCIDADTNNKEILGKIDKYLPTRIKKRGGKGWTYFYLSDGKNNRDYYKFKCPGNEGFIEVFYGSNRQIVCPPSWYQDEKLYVWEDPFCTLLSVEIEDLPILPTEYVENIGSLIGSPTVAVANMSLPKSAQFKDGQNRTIAINELVGKIYRQNPNPDLNQVAEELLAYDAQHFCDNSFFLDPRKAFNKTNSRSANILGYLHSINSTIYNKTGQGVAFAEPVQTETITFAKLVPVTEAHFKQTTEAPEFDKDLIPECWRSMVDEICEGQGVPHQGIFMSMLTSLGACLQGNTVIRPLKEEKYFRRTNLACAMVASSGSKKSDVVKTAIYEIQKIDKLVMQSNSKKDLATIQDLEFKIEALVKEKKKGMDLDKINEEIFKLQDELEAKPLKGTKFLYENAPVQKMINDAKKNQKTGLFLIKDEMKQIFSDFRRKGNEDCRTFYMQGFDGNQGFRYSTLSRGDDTIDRHTLSMLTNVQPDVLNVYIKSLYSAYGENDGFLQRIILVPFGAPVVTRPKPVNFKRFTKQYELFNRAFYSAECEAHVAEDAREKYIDMRQYINGFAAKYHQDPISGFLSKHEGLLGSIAYLYEFMSSEGKPTEISLESLNKAMRLLKYLGECAKYLFDIKDHQQDYDMMVKTAEMLTNRHFRSGSTQSEMFQSLRGMFKYPTPFYHALKELSLRGYVTLISNNKINSIIVHINPEVYLL